MRQKFVVEDTSKKYVKILEKCHRSGLIALLLVVNLYLFAVS
jgi:hypothetical protein